MSRGKKHTAEQIISKLREASERIGEAEPRLKRLLADAELDKSILKEAASGNF